MAKEIIWSLRAQNDRKSIFTYWNLRNKSTVYSKKLNSLFEASIQIISDYPKIGKVTNDKTIRVKVVSNYLIIYEVLVNKIITLTIWDNRQNPKSLKL